MRHTHLVGILTRSLAEEFGDEKVELCLNEKTNVSQLTNDR